MIIAELEKKIVSLEEKVNQHTNTQSTNNGNLSITGGSGSPSIYTGSPQTLITNQGGLNIESQISGNTPQLNIPSTTELKLDTPNQLPTPIIQPQTQNCEAVMLNGEPLPSNGQLIPSDQITVVCK